MTIEFTHPSGAVEIVNTNLFTPQLLAPSVPYSKLITYPTFNGPDAYSYTGPYYGTDPNANSGATGNTTPVEGQLTAVNGEGDAVGPTGSVLFPLGNGGAYIGFYSPTGVLYTKFKMDDASAAAAGIAEIATAIAAGDAYLYLYPDGSGVTS